MIGVDRLARWSVEREKMFVQHPERRRRVLVLDLVIFIVTAACWCFWPLFVGTWVGVVIGIVVGLQLGRTALLGIRRASTYRSGWLDGRQQMMGSLAEALRRGMRPDEWVVAEAQRDMATLGIIVDIDADMDPDELLRRMRDDDE